MNAPTAPTSVSQFLELVRKSGVVDPSALDERYPSPDELPRDPQQCAAELIRDGLLTPFQAKSLLAGRFRGFLLGVYKVLEPLGKGGMGQVFLAEHASLKRKAALKVLPADKAKDKLTLERFRREARAAAALDHPNIVRLHDISQGGGVQFLVMEYVEGNDLQSLMGKTGPLHFAQAAHYIAQAAAGLQHAHEKGFVHRDVKPANLILAKDGTVKILDMGLARSFTDDHDNLTAVLGDVGDVAGTADFIAPEQALNQPVDERTDIYSLGATLYALVTGNPPFKGSTAQKLMQHQVAEPPSLARLRGMIPEALGVVVAKMMAKKPAERYQSMADVIDALGPWLPAPTTGNVITQEALSGVTPRSGTQTGLGTAARLAPGSSSAALPAEPPARAGRPWVIVVGIGAVVVALGLTGTLVGMMAFAPSDHTGPLPDRPKRAAAEVPVSPPTPVVAEKWLQLPLDQATNICTAQPVFTTTTNADGQARSRLMFRDGWGPREFRGVPFKLIDPTAGVRNAVVLSSDNPAARDRYPRSFTLPVNAPLAAVHVLGGVSSWGWPFNKNANLPSGEPKGTPSVVVRVYYADGEVEEHEWANGVHLADYYDHTPAKGQVKDVPESEFAFGLEYGHQVRYLAVKPRRAAVVKEVEFAKAEADRYTAPIFLAVTAEKAATADPPRWQLAHTLSYPKSLEHVVLTPDESHIVGVGADRLIRVWDLKTGKVVKDIKTTETHWSADLTPDGKRVVVVGSKGQAEVYDLETGTRVAEFPAPPAGDPVKGARAVKIAPDGKRVLLPVGSQIVLWDLDTAAEVRRYEGFDTRPWGVTISPDGKYVAAAGGAWGVKDVNPDYGVRVWETETGKLVHTLTGHQWDVRRVLFSPDSQTLATAGYENRIKLWDVATGQLKGEIVCPPGYCKDVWFLPGGLIAGCGGKDNYAPNTPPGGQVPSDNTIRIWDPKTGLQVACLTGHTNGVLGVRTTRDGKWLVSASQDSSVRVWQLNLPTK